MTLYESLLTQTRLDICLWLRTTEYLDCPKCDLNTWNMHRRLRGCCCYTYLYPMQHSHSRPDEVDYFDWACEYPECQ